MCLGGEESVPRARTWDYRCDLGNVWIVAVDAVISNFLASCGVPIARHSTVGAVLIVAKLRPMTLRAQPQRVSNLNHLTTRKMETWKLPPRVARTAFDSAVGERHPKMEVFECIHTPRQGRFRLQRVAGLAANPYRLP